ncbi:protease inhibitor Inh/omp19 family protein [Blastochloris sulfoviridis]|nr:protease inhibitor Inh/omp19 family protein [Blastochloris sulfoviridis]
MAETAKPQKAPEAVPAATVPDEVRDLAGAFEITDAESTRRCAMTLDARVQSGGFALAFDKPACAAALPFLSTVNAWALGPAGAIRLIDGTGRTVAEFGETEDGLYEMARSGEGIFFLSRAGGSEPPGPVPADLAGTWSFARQPDRPICKVTLTEKPATEDTFKLSLAAGCDQTITSFAPVSWRIERTDMVILSSSGDQLRFEQTEDNVWRKVPEGNRPLLLIR